jgi:hypothetical protein
MLVNCSRGSDVLCCSLGADLPPSPTLTIASSSYICSSFLEKLLPILVFFILYCIATCMCVTKYGVLIEEWIY